MYGIYAIAYEVKGTTHPNRRYGSFDGTGWSGGLTYRAESLADIQDRITADARKYAALLRKESGLSFTWVVYTFAELTGAGIWEHTDLKSRFATIKEN